MRDAAPRTLTPEELPDGVTPPEEPPAAVKRYVTRLLLDRLLALHAEGGRPGWWGLIEWTMQGETVRDANGAPARIPFSTNIRRLWPLVEQLAADSGKGG